MVLLFIRQLKKIPMKAFCTLLVLLAITLHSKAQTPFASNLPIVVINCTQTIPDEPKVPATMGIIYNGVGVINNYTDTFNNYNNAIGIETRGSSSQGFPQQSYSVETRDSSTGSKQKVSLLGMPPESDWVLYAPYNDKTCMRNVLAYDIANKMGHYASRTRFVELFLNGQYDGIYVLMEKIKRDSNRVNIGKINTTDTLGDRLTGGYIVKVDKSTGNGTDSWNSIYPTSNGNPITFLYHYPSELNIVPAQKTYIRLFMDSFERALKGPNFKNPLLGYRKYLGVNSTIDYLLLNEISRNVDGYRISTFMYKDRNSKGGKLKIGPAWDYNLGFRNADYCNGALYTGWAYKFNTVCTDPHEVPFWWVRLVQDTSFTNQMKCRWLELRATTLHLDTINAFIDSAVTQINQAQARHFVRWPILGIYTWPNPSPIPANFTDEISSMKTWIYNRITWMDANLQGVCAVTQNENTQAMSGVIVYPNPTNGKFTISVAQPEKTNYYIHNTLGQVVASGAITVSNEIDISAQTKGMYYLYITNSNATSVSKLVLE